MSAGKQTQITDDQSEALVDIGEEILETLDTVANSARDALIGRTVVDPSIVLVGTENTMTGPAPAGQRLKRIVADQRGHIERIVREPFVSRVVVLWEGETKETLYVTRGSAAAVVAPGVRLASQAARLGRLSELDPGDTGTIANREFKVIERVHLRPEFRDAWDALDDRFDFQSWNASLASLRRFLETVLGRPLAADEENLIARLREEDDVARVAQDGIRRTLVERMTLRDQPTLDKQQGDVFRLPLDYRVLLVGPPGSGKTTTLIRRLAQKRHPEGLTEDEEDLLSATGMRSAFDRADGWVMFSPTELLQLYLRDSFNREQVPADSARNLRTWERERRDLARNVLHILRSAGEDRGFELDEGSTEALKDSSSAALSKLYDELTDYAERTLLVRIDRAFAELAKVEDKAIVRAVRRLRDRLGGGEAISIREVSLLLDEAQPLLQPELTRLKKETDDQIDSIANRLLRAHAMLLDEIVSALPNLQSGTSRDDDDEDDEDDDETAQETSRNPRRQALEILLSSLRVRARAYALGRKRLSGRAARLLELVGNRVPAETALVPIGARLVTMSELRIVLRAPRRLVMTIPTVYGQFRRARSDRLLTERGVALIKERKLSRHEVDVVILAMLTFARRFFDLDRTRFGRPVPEWLDGIRHRYVPQVFVDEATDFSAVQLACMLEIAHPSLRSWFASGDFRQRITAHGIQRTEELEWLARVTGLGEEIEVRDVSVEYRQSPRLASLARAVDDMITGRPVIEAKSLEDDGPAPLLLEQTTDATRASWLADRILEVERGVGRLPSIAVFVSGEEHIDPLTQALRPRLAAHNIVVTACRDGAMIGDRQEVRVFDIQHIKGLEFEAVFFVGIDELHQRLPGLFERFLFVGITRAATYLGVTSTSEIPKHLERLRSHFASGGWG